MVTLLLLMLNFVSPKVYLVNTQPQERKENANDYNTFLEKIFSNFRQGGKLIIDLATVQF